jgi:hypothetical protein
MKYFELLICAFYLVVLMTACGGKIRKNMEAPGSVPVGKIETVDRVVAA